MNTYYLRRFASLAAIGVACWTAAAYAQTRWVDGAPTTNWSDDENWDNTFAPDPALDSAAIVGSSVAGAAISASVEVNGAVQSPTVQLGDGGGTSGTVTIGAGSSLTTVADLSVGDVQIGLNGGTGVLNVSGGLTVAGNLELPTSGGAASTLALTGSATVTAPSAFLDKQFRVEGSNVNFSTTGNLTLGLAGTHTWVIPATGASKLNIGGNADLGGTLKVEFPDGAPSVGSTWNLIDAASIDADEAVPSGFGNVDASAVSGLGQGQRFAVNAVPSLSSINGVFGQLALEQHPVLIVDRATNTISISNPGGVASIGIDAYVVGSELGGLNPTNFTGGFTVGSGWQKANPTANALSQLKTSDSSTVAANTSIGLGSAFAPPTPTAFGVENEDITFRYAKPGGDFINGEVVYTGLPNNTLTLNVDPDTGQAQLVNGTSFTVAIDTYVISSESGSLLFANGSPATTWNSLQDQGTSGGAWFEANPSVNQISELLTAGGLTLAPNATVNLGAPFNDGPTARQDLVFQFAIVESAQGDFNGDGSVDAADYTVWRDNLNALTDAPLMDRGDGVPGVTQADYLVWKSSFGTTNSGGGVPELLTGKVLYGPLVVPGVGGVIGAPVPEPSSFAALVVVAIGVLVGSGRRAAGRE